MPARWKTAPARNVLKGFLRTVGCELHGRGSFRGALLGIIHFPNPCRARFSLARIFHANLKVDHTARSLMKNPGQVPFVQATFLSQVVDTLKAADH
jgi:hypothetical protein